MLIKTYDQTGAELSQTSLSAEVFGVKMNLDLVHQVAVSQMANRRQISAHTKGRGEVSGGGKKPWRQKGTGRARHGSTRSPIWRHGGVVFGPTKERVFEQKINKQMRRKALLMVLSEKAKDSFLILLDKLNLESPKTKLMKVILSKLPIKGSCLFALPAMDKNIILSTRNLTGIETVQAKDLNVLDLLNSKYLLMSKDSIKVIQETFSGKSEARSTKYETNSNDQNSKSKTIKNL
ncbi:MAG: 50S ribosomal protein L4 [Candidatus Nealsonbacteria bacterium]|nr:50S ribosomal protein L4 [Candidatus Nealsonbacteria bacterium]